MQVVTELSRAFALCAASDAATEIRDDVSFFQALQAALNKQSTTNRKTPEQIDAAIRQLVSKAITTEGQVIDVFTAAGLPKPDISILSDQFLAEVRGLKHKNVAAELLEKHGIACDLMHGFDWDKWTTGKPTERLALIPAGQEHILEQEDGKKRWVQVVTELSRAFALCAASDEATEIRDDVSFFQALQAALNKQSSTNRKTPEQIDAAIRQLVSKAITTEGQVIDVFTAAGLTPSPPAQSGLAQCCALSVSVAPLAPSAAQAGHLTPSPPAQSGCAQRFASSVALSPIAEFGSRSAWRRWTARR